MRSHLLVLAPLILGPTQLLAQAKQPADPLDGPPYVTCKAWAVADGKSGELLWSYEAATPRAMASTTKIMTAWLVLTLAAQDARVLDEVLIVSEKADKTGGSTAGILTGEQIPVRDVLYGLLLPSGNDAAMALAEHFGPRFDPPGPNQPADPVDRFVTEMNRRAAALGMKETRYLDPHGMGGNQSSARDLTQLAWNCMKDDRFRQYVATTEHRCVALGEKEQKREIAWKNTNQLLGIAGYEGVKTGTTAAAGACLVSSGRRGQDQLLVVVLGSTSPDARFVDTRNLFRWAWLKRGHGR
jgi:D-alanyl-D-alanine carboxypeptidase (penicillin-binding protein 5/6)